MLNRTIENIDQLAQNNEEITGLPTGYAALDKMTAGLQKEELIILAARPAVGKTAFALNIAQKCRNKNRSFCRHLQLRDGCRIISQSNAMCGRIY